MILVFRIHHKVTTQLKIIKHKYHNNNKKMFFNPNKVQREVTNMSLVSVKKMNKNNNKIIVIMKKIKIMI